MTHSAINQLTRSAIALCSTLLIPLIASLPSSAACSTPSGGPVPLVQHLVLVIEENTSWQPAHDGMPWLLGKATTNGGYSAINCYVTNASGSLLDYLMLSGGSLFNFSPYSCNGNKCSASNPLPNPNIFSLSDSKPLTWKVYAQTYQNSGGYVKVPDNNFGTHYYRRHNAATWYAEVLNNVLGAQGEVVDFEQFFIDVAGGTLPRYAIIAPDGAYDAHDGGNLTNADNFLKNNLDAAGSVYTNLLTLPDFQAGGSGLLFVTFDNGTGDAAGTVFTALIGPNVKQGYVSNFSYKHENALRTMIDALGLTTYPGASATAVDMADFFPSTAGSVVINSPGNNSFQGPAVLVNAAARELGSTIDHMEVWDNGTKLGNVFSSSINQIYNVTGNGSHTMTVQDIGPAPNFAVLHKLIVHYTVTATDGVFLSAPASGSTQGELFPVQAYSVESSADIDHMEVWADGVKVGDSPKGSVINQFYSDKMFSMLGPGSHQLTVQDVAAGSVVLHNVTIPITVAATNNIYVNSPVSNGTYAGSVPVNAYAYEQAGCAQGAPSCQQVDHLEVWDNFNGTSTKLGNSPLGYATTSLFMNQSFSLQPGTHTITVQDIGPGPGFAVLHKVTRTVTIN